MDESQVRAIANEVAAEHVRSHELRFTLQGILLVVLLGAMGLLFWALK